MSQKTLALMALLAASTLTFPLCSWARVPRLLAAVEKQYSAAGAFQADFSQTEVSAVFGEKKQSQGKLDWKSPNKLRWETTSPDRNLIVSNGKTIWVYTPPFDETESGQVLIKKASEVKSRLLDALLAAKFSAAARQGLRIQSTGNRTFRLKPPSRGKSTPSSALKVATVQIANDRPVIAQISLEYEDGNQSTLTFSNINLGTKLRAEHFEFKVPRGTDILKE